LFAEATTCQLEFKYLAKLTGRREYYERVCAPTLFNSAMTDIYFSVQAQTAMNVFYRANVKDGLFNDNWLMKDGAPTGGKSSSVTNFTIIFE